MPMIVFSHPLLLKLAWFFNSVLSSSSSGVAQLFSSLPTVFSSPALRKNVTEMERIVFL